MTLYDPHRHPDVDPEDAVVVVHRFLERVRAWAREREIPKIHARLATDPDPADAAKLHAWITYAAFTDHALREIEDGTLDRWFVDDPDEG